MSRLIALSSIVLCCASWTQAQYNYPPPVDRSGSQRAQQEVSRAQSEVTKAGSAVTAVVTQLRKVFEASAEYKAALAEVAAAQANFDAVRKPILEALATKSAFQDAKASKEAAEKDRDKLAKDEAATPEQRIAAAKAVLEAGTVVSRLEADALNAEPKYGQAKVASATAHQKVTELTQAFEASVKQNADWQKARTVVEQAQQKVAQARMQLTQALQREAELERQRRDQIVQIDRQRADEERRRREQLKQQNRR